MKSVWFIFYRHCLTCSWSHLSLTIAVTDDVRAKLRGAKALAEATMATMRAMISCIVYLRCIKKCNAGGIGRLKVDVLNPNSIESKSESEADTRPVDCVRFNFEDLYVQIVCTSKNVSLNKNVFVIVISKISFRNNLCRQVVIRHNITSLQLQSEANEVNVLTVRPSSNRSV